MTKRSLTQTLAATAHELIQRAFLHLNRSALGGAVADSRLRSTHITLGGIGIGGFKRTTVETLEALAAARIVLHLSAYGDQIRRYCRNVVDLNTSYWTGEVDLSIYRRLADAVLDEARRGPGVVMVADGHPGFYDQVTWDIYRRGRQEGLTVQILPAVSCLGAMMATCELELSPTGVQIIEATSLVLYNRQLDPKMDALIMQVGWFGSAYIDRIAESHPERFVALTSYLERFYPGSHVVKLIEAPAHEGEEPTVVPFTLSELAAHHGRLATASNLWIPASTVDHEQSVNEELRRQLTDKDYFRRVTRS